MESTNKTRKRIHRRRRSYYIAIAVLAVLIAVTLCIVIPEAERRTAQANEIERLNSRSWKSFVRLSLSWTPCKAKFSTPKAKSICFAMHVNTLATCFPGIFALMLKTPMHRYLQLNFR